MECFQWKAHGQCSKGDSCSFSLDRLAQGDLCGGQRRKGRSSSLAPSSRAKTDGEGEKPQKHQATKMKTLQTKGAKFRAVTKNCKSPSYSFWNPPVCQNYKSETECKFGRTCFFRHVEAEEKPSKKSKKGGVIGSVALLKESRQLGCVSQDSYPRKSSLREEGKLGSKHAVKFSKGTWHQIQNS